MYQGYIKLTLDNYKKVLPLGLHKTFLEVKSYLEKREDKRTIYFHHYDKLLAVLYTPFRYIDYEIIFIKK